MRNGWIHYKGYNGSSDYSTHYKDDKWHNEDGPAWIDGTSSAWYLGHVHYPDPKSDLEWALTVKKWKEAGGVTNGWLDYDRCKRHYHKDIAHNEDGPSVIYEGGLKCYYLEGKYIHYEKWLDKRR
jgi:hypothetical protein